jgi:predicted RecA/RadA family phage recombinase
MKNQFQPTGDVIAMTVPYAGGVVAGQGVLVGSLFGVAATDGAQNASVEAATVGVYDLTKQPALAISAGARVFWDDTNRRITTTATSNHCIGRALVAALAGDATVRTLLGSVTAAGA